MGDSLSNSPTGATVGGWWWVIHLVHNNLYQRQIAFSFLNNSQMFTRIMNNGTWNSWTLVNGEQYLTSEAVIGKWVDDKPLYRKTIDTGALPNNSYIVVAHNIANIERIVKIQGHAYRSTDLTSVALPHASTGINSISCNANGTNISITTYSDRTDFTSSYVTLEYTKTTD